MIFPTMRAAVTAHQAREPRPCTLRSQPPSPPS
jgi:hypothetical protein